jgi:hypothetical protein
LGWRFRVEFIADPRFMDIVCLLELVDNALADIAEGSDIIGEYFYLYWHVQKSNSFQSDGVFNNLWIAEEKGDIAG